jgi:hypothetical protein
MSQIRAVARPGLTYMDANLGRLVEEGPDVTDAKAKLRELDPDLSCYYDTVQFEWVVVWWDDRKKQDTFILSDENLERAYQRVLKGRNDAPGAETGDQMAARLEREQDQAKDAEMDTFRNISGDVAERLIHAFKKDGIHDHENIYGPKPRKWAARKDVRVRESRTN